MNEVRHLLFILIVAYLIILGLVECRLELFVKDTGEEEV